MRIKSKVIFYLLLAVPWFWITYLVFTDGLGANPVEEINKKLGDYTLYLLLANLYWGCLDAVTRKNPLKKWHALRRPLGVAAFIYATFHLLSYFGREGDFNVALK